MDALTIVKGNVLATVSTVLLAALLYYNYLLWRNYLATAAWAFLVSQALHRLRAKTVSLIRKWRGEAAEDPAGGEAKKKAKKGHDVAKGFSAWVKAKLDRKTLVRRLLTNSFPIFATLLLLSPGFSSWADFTFILGSLAMVVVTVYFLIWVLDKRLLSWWLPIMSDESFVAISLASTFFVLLAGVVVFLGINTVMEGAEAITDSLAWMEKTVNSTFHDESSKEAWATTIEKAKGMMLDNFDTVRAKYNETEWWPAVETLDDSLRNGTDMALAVRASRDQLEGLYSDEAWWTTVDSLVNWAVDDETSKEVGFMEVVREQLTTDKLSQIGQYFLGLLQDPVSLAVAVMASAGQVLGAIAGWGSQTFMFIYFLLLFLTSELDTLSYLVRLVIPTTRAEQDRISRTLRFSFEGVFFLPFQLASCHATVTLVTFFVLGAKFPYFATFLSFTLSLFQILGASTFVFVLPWTIARVVPFFVGSGSWMGLISGVLLLVIHMVLFITIDGEIYAIQEMRGRISSALLTAFSLALGFSVFGLSGFVAGPLLLTLLLGVCQERLGSNTDVTALDDKDGTTSTSQGGEEEVWSRDPSKVRFTVNVQAGSHPETRTRVAVPVSGKWSEFLGEIRRQMAISAPIFELRSFGTNAYIRGVHVLQPGELLIAHKKRDRAERRATVATSAEMRGNLTGFESTDEGAGISAWSNVGKDAIQLSTPVRDGAADGPSPPSPRASSLGAGAEHRKSMV